MDKNLCLGRLFLYTQSHTLYPTLAFNIDWIPKKKKENFKYDITTECQFGKRIYLLIVIIDFVYLNHHQKTEMPQRNARHQER